MRKNPAATMRRPMMICMLVSSWSPAEPGDRIQLCGSVAPIHLNIFFRRRTERTEGTPNAFRFLAYARCASVENEVFIDVEPVFFREQFFKVRRFFLG